MPSTRTKRCRSIASLRGFLLRFFFFVIVDIHVNFQVQASCILHVILSLNVSIYFEVFIGITAQKLCFFFSFWNNMAAIIIMVNAFFVVCLCFMIMSMLTFFCLRKKHEIKARCPRLCLAIGFLTLIMFVLIGVNELKGFSCGAVLWTGNIILNLLMLLGVMRDWVITVMSDRIMRKKYRWTLQTTLAFQFFSREYLYLNQKHQCFFLTPWWELLPLAVPVFLSRIFLALRKKHLQITGRITSGYSMK